MPRETYRINTKDTTQIVRQVNDAFDQIAARFALLEGTDGAMVKVHNHLDLQNKYRVVNAVQSADEHDAVTRHEARESAMYLTNGKHVASGPIVAPAVYIPVAVSSAQAVNLSQLANTISGQTASRNATFVTEAAETTLPNSRRLAAGTDINLTDGGAGSTLTIAFRQTAVAFASLPGTPHVGDLAVVNNSSTNAWGANADGAGALTVLVWWNGANWTVVGK